ncbi:MAG: FtsQ-type POTRA domain-containing protein [Pyrinomonadaceae bacterium]
MAASRRKATRSKASSVKLKNRSSRSRARGQAATVAVGRYVVPTIVSILLLTCLGILAYVSYDRVTGSDFFALKSVEVHGTERTGVEDVRRLAVSAVEQPGVWNADLEEVRTRIEKLPFVKSAAVSRVLPSGVRIQITERVPAAVVNTKSGNYLVDEEGAMLAAVKAGEKEFPFILHGWDESKTERAVPENRARLKVYKKMLDEWRPFDLSARVKEVHIANPREPVAVVEDSGRAISITLARESLGKSLKTAIEALSGKGSRVKSIDAGGVYPVINYLEF